MQANLQLDSLAIRVRKQKVPLPKVQKEEIEAANHNISDGHVQKKLTAVSIRFLHRVASPSSVTMVGDRLNPPAMGLPC
jgi:hypothetical protein